MPETEPKPSPDADDTSADEPVTAEVVTASSAGESGARKALIFTFKAIEIRLRFIAILLVIGLTIGYWDTLNNYWDKWTRPTDTGEVKLSGGEEFYCPMHPSVVRDQPEAGGATPNCPICGMPLSKRKKGELAELPEGVLARVQLSPYRVQLAGVQTAEVILRPLTKDVRTVGFVTVNEALVSRIVVRVDGYLEKLHVNTSFAIVAEGDPLAEIYSPTLYSAAQELLIAHSSGSSLEEGARDKLRFLGVSDEEIAEIERTGKATDRLLIRSPHAGHVFQKGVFEGEYVTVGQMLFEVADLSTVWIEADVFEKDAALLRAGQEVEATIEGLPGQVFAATIGLVHPHVETATRTNRVRFELDNPEHQLRPGMYATVSMKIPIQEMEPFRSRLAALEQATAAIDDASLIELQQTCPVTGFELGSMGPPIRVTVGQSTVFLCCEGCREALDEQPDYFLKRLVTISPEGVLAVPERAVIDTGREHIVYVESEPGQFDALAVVLGPRAEGYYPVIEGLRQGDRVVAAGAFLIDAETRLNPAAAGAYFGASGGPSDRGGQPAAAPQASSASGESAARSYEIRGAVTAISEDRGSVTLDHEEIKGLMAAMEMPFEVENPALLEGVEVGDRVEGTLRSTAGGFVITELRQTEQ